MLQTVGYLRVATPLVALTIMLSHGSGVTITLVPFVILFAFVGALSNGMTIGFLGYLMEISPDTQRPAYSAYFNAMASPAALLPLLGAFLADTVSLHTVFGMTMIASLAQLLIYRRLKT